MNDIFSSPFNIHSDYYFTNGKVLKTCQDYTISGEDPVPHIVLCDGCSSSKNTDVGARILAHSVQNSFKLLFETNSSGLLESPFPYKSLGKMTIGFAKSSIVYLNLDNTCLDATLIISFIHGEYVTTMMYGDGYIIAIMKDGNFEVAFNEFEGNAPYYLSYQIDQERDKLFRDFSKQFNDESQVLTRYFSVKPEGNFATRESRYLSINPSGHFYTRQRFDIPIIFTYPLDSLKTLLIFSDGIGSFVNENSSRISYLRILKHFTDFKTTSGEFIKRRARKAIEELSKEGIRNTDDVSVAGFMIEEKKEINK